MAKISVDTIIDKAIKGVVNAHKDYESWSSEWLWTSPEYMSTVYVAKEIAKSDGPKFITLENNAKYAIELAGAKGRGRLHGDIRENGRFDILLWWGNGSPRAPIEVKCQVLKADKILADVRRIEKVIHRNKEKSTIEFGAVVFYASCNSDSTFTAKERLEKSLDNIRDSVSSEVSGRSRIDMRRSKLFSVDDAAWCAAALLLKPKYEKVSE